MRVTDVSLLSTTPRPLLGGRIPGIDLLVQSRCVLLCYFVSMTDDSGLEIPSHCTS